MNEITNAEVIELKSIPSSWIFKNLIEVATLQRGKDLPLNQRSPGLYPVMGSNGFVGYHSDFIAQGPGVLVGRSGSVGKVTLVEKDFWPLNTTLWVKDFHGNDPRFVYYLLSYFDFSKYTSGVSVPTLNRNLVHPVKVCVPPVAEQRAISRVLQAVEGAHEARLHEIALERERKAALMEHLFTHGTRGELTKQTEIGEMPESWGIVKLGEVLTSTQYGLSVCGDCEGSYPILRMNCLVEGYVYGSDLQYVDLEKADFEKFRLNKGDILFNRTNSSDLVGKTGLFNLDGDFVFASYLIRLTVNENRLLSEFINYYINMNSIQARLRMLASRGVSQSNINATKLRSFLIPLPLSSEQKITADILKACDSRIFSLEEEARLLDEFFRAILEELMSGRLSSRRIMEMHPG